MFTLTFYRKLIFSFSIILFFTGTIGVFAQKTSTHSPLSNSMKNDKLSVKNGDTYAISEVLVHAENFEKNDRDTTKSTASKSVVTKLPIHLTDSTILLVSTEKPIETPFITVIAPPKVPEIPKIAANKSVLNIPIMGDTACIDLAFDSVSIVQIAEKFVEISYSIVNKGNAPAPIFGTKKTEKDNVAIHFYYSGTPRLSRGSLLADAIFLTEGLRETKGLLAPKAVYKGRFKLSLEKKNRFYGVIILQLDAFDILRHECDETNNIFSIVPKWY